MNDLRKKLDSELIVAAKSKDALRLSVLRMLKSAIKYKEIDIKPKELLDADIIQVISTMVKQRNDSITAYNGANRKDLADKESAEIKILNEFLPPQLSKDEIRAMLMEVVAKIGAKGAGDAGKVMKEAMPLFTGKAQGKEVNEIVREILSN